ncbi:MAG: flagellar hook-length control protein FliK [Eubacterium sp.]|nr:flagellar hook-length control protein FliK [Eubacterium sp.]
MAIAGSNIIQNNGSGSGAVPQTVRSRTYRTGNTTMSLHEGQVLKGVVTDVHGNKITLDMGNGASFTGELEDASRYSIGQKAGFRVAELGDNTITLKAYGDNYLLGMDDTVDQALEEASLPKTDRNIDIVQSLLENGRSISKDSIMNAIRLTSKFPAADVNAVITMDRLNMNMTDESVKQFEQYQNRSHQLLYKMDALTDSIGEMLTSIGEKVPRLASQVGTELIRLALESEPSMEESELIRGRTLPDVAEIPTFYDAEGKPVPSESLIQMAGEDMTLTDAQGKQIPIQEAVKALVDASPDLAAKLEDASPELAAKLSEAQGGAGGDGANPAVLTDAEAAAVGETGVTEDTEQAKDAGAFSRMRNLFSNFTDSAAGAIKNAVAGSGITEDFRTPFIHEQVGYSLSPEDRETFSGLLKDYPVSEEIKQGVADGSVTTRELLGELQKQFPKMSDEMSGRLISNKQFQLVIKSQFTTNWTLSPDEMREEGAMRKIYEKMSTGFSALEHFSETTLGKDLFQDLSGTAKDMSQNLDFMKTLNDAFQYIQLPIKLQNQNAHGDLYVMTRKEKLKRDPSKLKAVLHLEMDHLGTLDIHITKENTAVTAAFYTDNEKTEALFRKNMDMLKDAINEQGFAFQSTMNPKEKDIDIVKDFIAQEAPVGDMKRYSFDLRA